MHRPNALEKALDAPSSSSTRGSGRSSPGRGRSRRVGRRSPPPVGGRARSRSGRACRARTARRRSSAGRGRGGRPPGRSTGDRRRRERLGGSHGRSHVSVGLRCGARRMSRSFSSPGRAPAAETEGRLRRWSSDIERVGGWLAAAERVTVLTGAGISTDSGIPDFRGPQGVWTKNPTAEKTSTLQHYLADPEVRRTAWRMRAERRCGRPSPTPGTGRSSTSSGWEAARRRHPEHRRAASEGRERPGARHRGPRHGVVDSLPVLRRPPADGRDAGAGARRRRRPAVRSVRRHPQERHDLVRPSARAGGDRPGDGGLPGVRRAPRRRVDARCVPGRRRVPLAAAAGARVVIINGAADRVGRARRRRAPWIDLRVAAGSRRRVESRPLVIYHAALPEDWDAATKVGRYEAVHKRGDADRRRVSSMRPTNTSSTGVANRFYADVDELVVLSIDPAAVGAQVVDEADPRGRIPAHLRAVACRRGARRHAWQRPADRRWPLPESRPDR